MKIPKSHFSEYFKRSVVFLIKTELAVFITSILEYVDLCTNMIDISYQIFFFNETYNYKEIKLSNIILKISPYQYFFNYVSSNSTDDGFNKNYLFIIVYGILAIWYFSYFLLISNCNLDEMNPLESLLQKISINVFDYILYRILPIYGFDVFSREIMRICSKPTSEYTLIDLVKLFLALFCLGFLVILHLLYYSKISVWSNFRVIESFFTYYPYDSFFSAKCDMIFCTLKCLITLNKNYLFYNNNKVNYICEFISVMLLFTFIGYVFFIVYLFFFSYQILYFFMTGFNMLRLFLLLFMFESIAVRILLSDNNDYKSFLVFEIIFIIFDCYIIFASFYNYVLSKAIKSQNYLAVCWFIQANKIDIQQFITEWIANHKTVCTNKDCEICEELIKGHIPLSTIDVENMENNENAQKEKQAEEVNNNAHNKSSQVSKDAMNINLIMKIYPPYQFNLKLINISLKLKKNLGEDDLIRLDFLYLTVLFLSNRNVEYRLFSKICNLIIQYADNINVSVSLMLIFEIIRKSNLDLIKDYDLIKKNEDLRNSLKEYIVEYENFIHFGAKSPDNYLFISKKFREFKKLTKSIHTLFKKNLECNYQLLIMRYAYETLLHINFKNMTPFDLGFFSDFLDYHYNGDKLFLLKYIIDRDTFTIIKGSKEVLKYQGNSLDSIFPDYLKEIGLNLFKNQLENVEKENQKPIFNFIIKDLVHNETFGFVDSFKMKYFVYPTNMINELLLQANFINCFTSIMIFEEYEGEQILFAFSAQLYKFFGITPNMIYVLKKAGMIVNFDTLFPKKKNNKKKNKQKIEHNLDDNTYSFEYKQYINVYKKLLECDGLNDVANYLTLKDKLNEMQQMAHEDKELLFNIHLKDKFENCGLKYDIFNIKEIRKKKKGYQSLKKQVSATKMDSFNESESSNEEGSASEDDDFNMKYEGKGLNISMPTLSSASLSRQSSIRTTSAKNKKDGKVDEKTKRQEKVNRYTIIILLFGVFLIAVSIIFLFLEISENNKFKQLFQLFQTFKIFKRGIESSPLSLLSNYCYYSEIVEKNNEYSNGQQCMNFYREYSKNISEKYSDYELLSLHPIYTLIQEEIKDKYNDIITTFNDYQKAIYNLDSGVINKISEITAFSYSITVEGNLVTLVQTRMNFISLCREYNNYITTLLEGDAYMKELFSLVQFQDTNSVNTLTVVSEYEDSFTQTRKIMLLMLMAYPSIHIGLTRSSTIMQEEFHSSLNKIEVLLIIFFILQIILHTLLIVIFMMFLSVYVKMIKFNILTANKLFSDRKFLELQDKRVEQIKIMSNLYQENPNKISDKIETIDNSYKRRQGDAIQKKNKSRDNLSSQMSTGYDDSVSDNKSKSRSKDDKSRYKEERNEQKKEDEFDNTLRKIGNLINSEDENKAKSDDKTNGKKKNLDKSFQKEEKEEDDEEIPLASISQINNVPDKIFDRITSNYKIILFVSLSVYAIYCVALFVVTLLGCNQLSYLVNYCEVNNEIDGYLFDNFNTLLYMYITNSQSTFYGKIVYEAEDVDYLNDGINDFYAAIQDKETIESEHGNLFPPIYDIINLDCSQGMMPDDYFENAARIINTHYDDYFKGICKIFPVATTGNDNSMLLEVIYMIDQLAHRFENVDFSIMFNQMRNSVLFDCYTLVLTLNRIIRNYFNNYIFIDEVNSQFDYFTTLTVFYLVFNMIIEIIIFLVLNFGIIYKIKINNKLIMDFISSLKF